MYIRSAHTFGHIFAWFIFFFFTRAISFFHCQLYFLDRVLLFKYVQMKKRSEKKNSYETGFLFQL